MAERRSPFSYKVQGRCPACGERVTFAADGPHLRDTLTCPSCGSLPRQRAIMAAIELYRPGWRGLAIHESSPGPDQVSRRLFAECADYTASQFVPDLPLGETVPRPQAHYRSFVNVDLERQSFPDARFDLVIAQDVFEHLFRPDLAIAEIARTLRPGGAFIATVPLVRRDNPSRRRAALRDGQVEHLLPAEFHGNPISDAGSLVTIDWGYDIAPYLTAHSGMHFTIFSQRDAGAGILGDLTEVIVGVKAPLPEL